MPLHTSIEKKSLFQELYTWQAPERHWKPKEKAWYVSYFTFFIVIIALFALLEQYIAIIAVIAFSFLWFVQGSTPPFNSIYTITNLGPKIYGKIHRWKDIKNFWFSVTSEVVFLNIDLIKSEILEDGRIHRLVIVVPENKIMEDIFYTLIRFCDYGERDEVNYNFLNKMIHGNYIDINQFLPEQTNDEDIALQEDINQFTEDYKDLTPNELTQEEKEEAIKIAKKKMKITRQ